MCDIILRESSTTFDSILSPAPASAPVLAFIARRAEREASVRSAPNLAMIELHRDPLAAPHPWSVANRLRAPLQRPCKDSNFGEAEVHKPGDAERSDADPRTGPGAAGGGPRTRHPDSEPKKGKAPSGRRPDGALHVPRRIGVTGFEPAASCSRRDLGASHPMANRVCSEWCGVSVARSMQFMHGLRHSV